MYNVIEQEYRATNLEKTNGLTDYEMQLWLCEKGHSLYDGVDDNDVDMKELCILANQYGYTWSGEKEVWMKRSEDSGWFV